MGIARAREPALIANDPLLVLPRGTCNWRRTRRNDRRTDRAAVGAVSLAQCRRQNPSACRNRQPCHTTQSKAFSWFLRLPHAQRNQGRMKPLPSGAKLENNSAFAVRRPPQAPGAYARQGRARNCRRPSAPSSAQGPTAPHRTSGSLRSRKSPYGKAGTKNLPSAGAARSLSPGAWAR